MKITISERFLRAYGRALDLSGTKEWPNIYNSRRNDYDALRRDWINVGKEIRESANKIGREKRRGIR